jgi:hypothetical protein
MRIGERTDFVFHAPTLPTKSPSYSITRVIAPFCIGLRVHIGNQFGIYERYG